MKEREALTVSRDCESTALWVVGSHAPLCGRIKLTNKLAQFGHSHGYSVQELLDAARAAPIEAPLETSATADAEEGVTISTRFIEDTSDKAVESTAEDPEDAFREALTHCTTSASVMRWDDRNEFSALDVDYHGALTPPSRSTALGYIAELKPRPFAAWVTHGGGIRALYKRHGALTAFEMAACGALHMRGLDTTCKAEVITTTRHPVPPRGEQKCSAITWARQDLEGILRDWSSIDAATSVPEEKVQEWLGSRGLTFGRFSHAHCPFDNSELENGAPPVLFNSDGVKCHRCAGMGHKTNGYITWARLLAGKRSNRVVESAKTLVPWEHAKLVLNEDYGSMGLGDAVLKAAYSALLKLTHDPEDPRVRRVFDDYYVVRGAGNVWLDSSTLNLVIPPPKAGRFLAMPPTTRAWLDDSGDEPKWKVKPDECKIDLYQTNQALPGWARVVPVRGKRVFGHNRRYGDDRFVRSVVKSEFPIRYLSESSRASSESVDEHFRRCFPMIDMDFLRLLLVARGYAESGLGRVPMLLITGPSGAGKGQTLALAAHILGDVAAAVPKDMSFELGFGRGLQTGGFVLCDEFAKNPRWTKERVVAEFNKFLPIARDYTYRELYIGPLKVRVDSVVIAANVAYGPEVMEHVQIGRRFVYVPLRRKVPADKDWTRTCGTGDISLWRTDPENARMADSLLSEIIDDFFGLTVPGETPTLFEDDARTLGFDTVANCAKASSDASEFSILTDVKTFFVEVCKLADCKGQRKCIDLSSESTVANLWRTLGDKDHAGKFTGKSNAIDELDLTDVLEIEGVEDSASVFMLAPQARGSKLYVAFKMASRKNGPALAMNGDIPSKLLTK